MYLPRDVQDRPLSADWQLMGWKAWLAVVVLAAQVLTATGLLVWRNVAQDGWGELPFSWQMYSERVD